MFKHYLDFKDLPLIGRIEISEPFKFDGSTFEVKREKGRHSRDVMIANEDIELELQPRSRGQRRPVDLED